MRTKLFLIPLLSFLALSPALHAQSSEDESYSDGIHGYTSVDYDSDSNTITVYSETDLDTDLLPYYGPRLNVNVTDDQNNNYNSSCSYDGPWTDYEDMTCQFNPGSGSQYTASASHWAMLNYYYSNGCGGEPGCGNQWIDYGNFQYLSDTGQVAWYGQDWFAPGPESTNNTDYSPDLILGGTTDSASLSTKPHCGDDRDLLINEFNTRQYYNGRSLMATFRPVCSDFLYVPTFNATNPYGTAYLAPTQTTDAGEFTLIQSYTPGYLQSFYDQLGAVQQTSSGFRNPWKELQVATNLGKTAYGNSRHIAGDAVDFYLSAGNPQTFYNFQSAGINSSPNACVEPHVQTGDYNHSHIDWRLAGAGTYYYLNKYGNHACPDLWRSPGQ